MVPSTERKSLKEIISQSIQNSSFLSFSSNSISNSENPSSSPPSQIISNFNKIRPMSMAFISNSENFKKMGSSIDNLRESPQIERSGSNGFEEETERLSPITRSKSSYSLNVYGSPKTFASSSSSSASPSDDLVLTRQFSSKSRSHKDVPETFLREIEQNGFFGVWNHPITRLYFLMFILSTGHENIYLFRHDAQAFRQDYTKLPPPLRKLLAQRIWNLYMDKKATLSLKLESTENGRYILNNINMTIESESPPANIFDDGAYTALKILGEVYEGTVRETEIMFPLKSSDGVVDSNESLIALPMESGSSILSPVVVVAKLVQRFRGSAFFQAMHNDLRGTKHLTTIQYKRAAERLMDMPDSFFKNVSTWEGVIICLESIGFDCDVLKMRLDSVKKAITMNAIRKASTKSSESISVSTDSVISNDYNIFSKDSTKKLVKDPLKEPVIYDSAVEKNWKKIAPMQFQSSSDLHTFVQCSETDKLFCEFCFKRSEEGGTLYRCEACQYICHKLCRNSVKVSCVLAGSPSDKEKTADADSWASNGDVKSLSKRKVHMEKIKHVEEKIQAIQKEIDIEIRIKDGLDKIMSAKGIIQQKKLKNKVDVDTVKQVGNSDKKMDILKQELQNCQVQLSKWISSTPVDEPEYQIMVDENSEDSSKKRELLKVLAVNPETKTETTKAIFVYETTTVQQIIVISLKKFVLQGTDEEYNLSYKVDQDDIPLRPTDLLMSIGIDFSQVNFCLAPKFDFLTKTKGTNEDLIKKQREVFSEILETESGYLDALRCIVKSFAQPLTISGSLNTQDGEELFANIEDILSLHEIIDEKLNQDRDSIQNAISSFETVANSKLYEIYCTNQSAARRLLNKLKLDPLFSKTLAQSESDPKLKKLSLPDLLVKPMHRITRYPLLLKRLISYTSSESSEYDSMDNLINLFEEKVQEVNEIVRKKESMARIHYIEDNLEFNGVCEKFRLTNPIRELLSEKNFTYIKKSSTATVEVTVMVFTDLVLIAKTKRPDQFQLLKPPLPFESTVFLDKTDSPGNKGGFQIIHLQQEIHTLQAATSYDKAIWLQEAELARLNFCSLCHEFELTNSGRKFDLFSGPDVITDMSFLDKKFQIPLNRSLSQRSSDKSSTKSKLMHLSLKHSSPELSMGGFSASSLRLSHKGSVEFGNSPNESSFDVDSIAQSFSILDKGPVRSSSSTVKENMNRLSRENIGGSKTWGSSRGQALNRNQSMSSSKKLGDWVSKLRSKSSPKENDRLAQ